MGSVIVVASSKGGCSKTTTVTALAVNLATRSYKVAVCDSDPNQAFVRWYKTSEAPALSVSTEVDHNKMTAKLARIPGITEVPYPVQMEPHLVVEYYSR